MGKELGLLLHTDFTTDILVGFISLICYVAVLANYLAVCFVGFILQSNERVMSQHNDIILNPLQDVHYIDI